MARRRNPMTLSQFLGKQFIDVIQWNEPEPGILAYRYSMPDCGKPQ
jgi:membrane protease subunit (stomatin/prohibitin family)